MFPHTRTERRLNPTGVDALWQADRGDFGVRDLTLRVEPGEFVGVARPSGRGKSTLIDLRDLSLASLRSQIGFVS